MKKVRIKTSRLNKFNDDKGAAAVEFALLLLPLALIIVGIMIFGLILNSYLEITHAAREGVRWAALRAPISEVEAKARAAAPGIDWTRATITVSGVPAGGATDDEQGDPATVTITYNIDAIRAIGGALMSFLPATISSGATQQVE